MSSLNEMGSSRIKFKSCGILELDKNSCSLYINTNSEKYKAKVTLKPQKPESRHWAP